jgi:hypothetical protein
MKNVRFIVPIAAIVLAVSGAFASGPEHIVRAPVVVTAMSSSPCTIDGTCDQSTSFACAITSTGLLFHIYVSPNICNTVATGKFSQ